MRLWRIKIPHLQGELAAREPERADVSEKSAARLLEKSLLLRGGWASFYSGLQLTES